MSVKPLPSDDLVHVLTHTRELWTEACGRDFFITGGTGFFGMWLLESFAFINDTLGLGMKATVLTRDPQAFARKAPHLTSRPDLLFIEGDVRTFAFPAGNFDYVIHAATEVGTQPVGQAISDTFDAIVSGTRRVLEFTGQAKVKKLLLTSSGADYGRQPAEITHVPEEYLGAPDPLLSGSAYGEGKRVSEHMCAVHARQHGYEVKIARCFAFIGAHLPLDAHYAIGNFIRDALAQQPIRIGGDGTPMRSYLYASDLTVWLWTLLFKAPSGRAYNVGSDDALDIATLAKRVKNSLGTVSPIEIAGKADTASPVARYVPSVSRASDELGLRISTPLDEAILKTVRWHHSAY